MNFFCSQCGTEQEIKVVEEFKTKTNQKMGKAKCPVCGLELYRRLDTNYDLGQLAEEKEH